MRNQYQYKNARVEIEFSNQFDMERFKNSTMLFLKKVMEERKENDNGNSSRIVEKK